MLDPKYLRKHPDEVGQKLLKKHFKWDVEAFKSLEEQRKTLQTRGETLQSLRKNHSKTFGKIKFNLLLEPNFFPDLTF